VRSSLPPCLLSRELLLELPELSSDPCDPEEPDDPDELEEPECPEPDPETEPLPPELPPLPDPPPLPLSAHAATGLSSPTSRHSTPAEAIFDQQFTIDLLD
jgi:hypothetical protein